MPFTLNNLVTANNIYFSDPAVEQEILSLARQAFDAYSLNRTVIPPPSSLVPPFSNRYGVFVSTMKDGAPRTCMGTLYPCQATFAEELIQNAVASAGRDRRFSAVTPAELRGLILIVSVITETPRPISIGEAQSLDPVTAGLAVQYQDRYGIVLTNETTNPSNMLKWARIRAGAPPNAPVRCYEIHDIRFMESQFK